MGKATLAQRALDDLVNWEGGNEPDLYPYFKDFLCNTLSYPKNKVKINETEARGFPDLSFYAEDSLPESSAWVVCEVKPERGFFRDENRRTEVWNEQLKRYITADTVYALLLDPHTVVILTPDGTQRGGVIRLDQIDARTLRDPSAPDNLSFLDYKSSVSTAALSEFVDGRAPSRYIDVSEREGQDAFHTALRISATELRNHATGRVAEHFSAYDTYVEELKNLEEGSIGDTPRLMERRTALEAEYKAAITLRERIIPSFEAQMGREVPTRKEEALRFIQKVYASEAANLVLARILFVRFFEDYDMTTRKISNGGILAFRNFHRYVRDDYRFLLEGAFRDLKGVYARLFEESVFDWAHEGDGELSRSLLRVFYRLNAFDFRQITGDILGNLYERFLDPKSRKEMGEFYTPQFVVDYILGAIGFAENPGPILDPACGSGTFLLGALELAIEYFLAKGIQYRDAITQAVGLVHGLDMNIFAAFISQLQVIWHLFPHLRKAGMKHIPTLHIYGGIDSLESGGQASLEEYLVTPRESAARRIRDREYEYIVGNPPYVRAERVKAPNRWSDYYREVATGKKDVSFYFLYRCLEGGRGGIRPWLKSGGKMGFIVSSGIANSKAAISLRNVLLRHHLLELVDLEALSNEVFTSGIATSRGTVAPLLVIAAREEAAGDDYPVRVTLATRETCLNGEKVNLANATTSSVPKRLFMDASINPFKQFATKIRSEDIPILRKLFENNKPIREFAASSGDGKKGSPAFQVGIQTGRGRGKIFDAPGEGRFPMAKGLHVHTFVLNESHIHEYVALEAAESKSIWRRKSLIGRLAYAVSQIGWAPQACPFNTGSVVAQKTCIVFVPKKEFSSFPWDIYLNSRIPRFIFGLVLRSALLEGKGNLWRSTINSNAVKLLPVPEFLLTLQDSLVPKAQELRSLADGILRRWDTIDNQIRESEKTTLALMPIRYVNVDDYTLFVAVRTELEEGEGTAVLQPYWRNQRLLSSIEGDMDALTLIKYMMDHPEFNLVPRPGARVPASYKQIAHSILEADISRNPDMVRFNEILMATEMQLAKAFGLTEDEAGYIRDRLGSPPFTIMQPRWPWVRAAIRATRIYEEDRFA